MKLLFVSQRFGSEVFGGAEAFCRQFALRLAARGHTVDVLTSAALSYVDWADHYPAGVTQDGGVTVNRLAVHAPRDNAVFGPLRERALARRWMAPYLQWEWMRQQGPWLKGMEEWLGDRSMEYDATVFITYLYWTAARGMAAARSPVVLHPTAHDEPPAYLPLFDEVFRIPDAFGFLTDEESDFVRRRYRVRRPSVVTGIGIEDPHPGDPAEFRRRFGLGDRPYIACVGRTDPGKGSAELFNFFLEFKRRNPGDLALVFIGEEVYKLPGHPDIVKTGFVDEASRQAGVEGAVLLVQPSYFESFSLVLVEAFAVGVPALVQGHSEVLSGQARRSRGAIPYSGFAEFESALLMLAQDPGLRAVMGASGKRFVEDRYRWSHVLEKYERFLARVA